MNRRSNSPGGKGKKGGRGKKNAKGAAGAFEVYAERTIWSPRFKGWNLYTVKKPRLPTENDKLNWVDNFTGCPSVFTQLIGNANDGAVRSLSTFVDQFDATKNMQDLLIIAGPGGSGKSTIAQIYVQEMLMRMDLPSSIGPKWCLYVDAKKYNANTYHELWKKIKNFLEAPQEKAIKVSMKVVLIDDCDTIPATHQNSLKTIMDKNSLRLKWIFTATESRKFIQFFQSKAMNLKTKLAVEKDTLLICLHFCQKYKIGYDRLGLKALFDANRDPPNNLSLSRIYNTMQKTFIKLHYISEENIAKIMKLKVQPNFVSPFASIEPLPRCRRCTLYPPCQHISRESLIERAQIQRDSYPDYVGEGRPVCAEFVRSGKCSTFNKHKRCTLAHPKNRTRVEESRVRCPLCTIIWPCQKCNYSNARNDTLALIDTVDARLELLQAINVPEPPIHLVVHLMEEYEDWEMTVSALAKFYITSDKWKIKEETKEWIETEHSTSSEEYEWKQQRLSRTYGEVLSTPVLKPKRLGSSARQSRMNSRPVTRGEGDDDGGSMGMDDEGSIAGSISGSVARSVRSSGSNAGGSMPSSRGRA